MRATAILRKKLFTINLFDILISTDINEFK